MSFVIFFKNHTPESISKHMYSLHLTACWLSPARNLKVNQMLKRDLAHERFCLSPFTKS